MTARPSRRRPRRSRRSRRCSGALLLVALGLLATLPAEARTPVDVGWWSALGAGGVLPQQVQGPDVPAGGFLVQGGPGAGSPLAVAALRTAAGPQARTLVLHAVRVVPGSAVRVCPLASGFEPAAGGDLGDAPSYDCSGAPVVAAGADGQTFSFDVERLRQGDAVAVAVVAASPLTRVVFAPPGADLLLEASLPPSRPAAPEPAPTTGSAVATSPAAAPGPAAGRGGPAPVVAAPGAAAPTGAAVPAVEAGRALPSSPSFFTNPVPPDAEALSVLLAVLLATAGLVLWRRPGASIADALRGGAP